MCVYVWVSVWMSVCMSVCVCVNGWMSTQMCVDIFFSAYACVYVWVSVSMCVCVIVCVNVCVNVYACVYTSGDIVSYGFFNSPLQSNHLLHSTSTRPSSIANYTWHYIPLLYWVHCIVYTVQCTFWLRLVEIKKRIANRKDRYLYWYICSRVVCVYLHMQLWYNIAINYYSNQIFCMLYKAI